MTQKKLIQFSPDMEKPDTPGTYGWGFDTNGFRVVMYAPREYDHPAVQALDRNHAARKNRNTPTEPENAPVVSRDKMERRFERRKKFVPGSRIRRGKEHGPAHIHVIDRETGRESKFELIQHFEAGQDKVRLIPRNGNRTVPLTPEQVKEVLPILNDAVPQFVQLWHEFYQDTKLGDYVTRVSEKFSCYERVSVNVREKKKFVQLEDMKTGVTTLMPFDTYLTIPPADNAQRPSPRKR